MGNVDEEGFLSEDIINYLHFNLSNHKDLFDFYRKVNVFAQDYSFKMVIPKSDYQKLCLGVLYLRSLSTFQSIYILSSRGILNETKVLIRTQFEIVFQLVAISKHKDLGLKFIQQELIQKKKLVNKTKFWSEALRKKFPEEESNKMILELQNEIKNKHIREISTKEYAEKADLLDFYNTGYAMLSFAVHANISDLGKHLVFDSNGIVSSFSWGPNDDNLKNLLATSIENKMIILNNLDSVFETNVKDSILLLKSNFKNIFKF